MFRARNFHLNAEITRGPSGPFAHGGRRRRVRDSGRTPCLWLLWGLETSQTWASTMKNVAGTTKKMRWFAFALHMACMFFLIITINHHHVCSALLVVVWTQYHYYHFECHDYIFQYIYIYIWYVLYIRIMNQDFCLLWLSLLQDASIIGILTYMCAHHTCTGKQVPSGNLT